ncbi:chemotaxis protein, partial [Stenotrophomonas maltophilia]
AKLPGHQPVLPPGAADEPAQQLEPGHPAPPPAPREEALQPHLDQALSWADAGPADSLSAPPAHRHEPIALAPARAA